LYTVTQVQSLDLIGKEIIGLSSNWTDTINDFQRTYSLFWLWILGAYEVTRVMDQHKDCFASHLQIKITTPKRLLAEIRMPFAKQELRGNSQPVCSELSVTDMNNGLNFDIRGSNHNSTTIIEDFLKFVDSITPKDIIKQMPLGSPN
jgi:hypothetical protein